MSQLIQLLFLIATLNNQSPTEQKEKDLAKVMFETVKGRYKNLNNFEKYAKEFYKSGKKFKVDPILISCVAYVESGYRKRPLVLTSTKCNEFGCRRVKLNRGEVGMLQVLWYDGSTKEGYKICTGEKLTGRKKVRRKKLSPYNVSICIGSYELSKWKQWCSKTKRKWYRQKSKYNLYFFMRNVSLRKYFWVQHYNWGPWMKKNSYPRKVLGCYKTFKKKLLEIEFARAASKRNDGKLGEKVTGKTKSDKRL